MSTGGVERDTGAARESESLYQVEPVLRGKKCQSLWVGSECPVSLSREVPVLCRGGLGGERGCAATPSINYYPAGWGGRGWWRPSTLSSVCIPGVCNSSYQRTSSSALNSCLCVRGYFPNYAQMEEKTQDFC